MPLISNNDLTDPISLPTHGEWVRLKKHLSKGDRMHIARAAARGSTLQVGKEIILAGDEIMDAIAFAMLEVAIKQWGGSEAMDRVQPTSATIRDLDEETADFIANYIDEQNLYPVPRSAAEKKGLQPSGAIPTSAEEQRRTSLDGS